MEERFLEEIEESPSVEARLIFADWLEERSDPRGDIIRRIETEGVEAVVGPIETRQTVQDSGLCIEQWPLYAADVAESVLCLWEREVPGDGRPRRAIEASRNEVLDTDEDRFRVHLAEDAAYYAHDYTVGVGSVRYVAYSASRAVRSNVFAYDAIVSIAACGYRNTDAVRYTYEAAGAAYDAAAGAAIAADDCEQQWQWNLLRLAEYKWFGGRRLWTQAASACA